MKVVQAQQFTQFEWDESKADRNLEKHGITFEDAAIALLQPHL